MGEGYFKVRKTPRATFHRADESDAGTGAGHRVQFIRLPGPRENNNDLGGRSLKILPDDPSVAPCILRPNEQLVYIPSRGKMDVRQVVASDYSDWKEGGLLFNNDSFEEILKTLERVYQREGAFAYFRLSFRPAYDPFQ